MGMSSHVKGVRDLDGRFADMIALKLACEAVSVEYPTEVKEYFGGYAGEDESYLRLEMEEVAITDAVREYSRDGTDGFEVDLGQLPVDVRSIRFENSY